ncbi:MAG: hypothetical protein GY940_09530 [bacterium]|nr:hypothetical protein [bacterium]
MSDRLQIRRERGLKGDRRVYLPLSPEIKDKLPDLLDILRSDSMTRRWENTSHLLILYDTPVDCPALFLLGNKEGMKGLHGVSERLEVAVYKKVVHFYF